MYKRQVHYFDISDTHPSRFSRRVPIWQMRDEYTAEVIDTLESTFGELNDKETLAVADVYKRQLGDTPIFTI